MTKQEQKAGLDAPTFRQVRAAEAAIENNGQWLAKNIRQWIQSRNRKAGTKQDANKISKEIQNLREALDTIERVIVQNEPGVPFTRKRAMKALDETGGKLIDGV